MRNSLQKLRQKLIVLPLLKLGCKIELLEFKRALKVDTLLLQKLKYLIREMNPKARLEGHDEDFDKTVYIAAFRLLKPEIFGKDPDFPSRDVPVEEIYDELKALYSKIQTNVDAIVQEISQEPRVRQVLIHCSLIQHFLEKRKKNSAVAEYHLARATKMDSGVIPLTVRDLYSLKRTVRKEMVALREIIADREALKIEIAAKEIVALLSIVSSFFLISGYLYNRLLFEEFGIDVSKFFTLSDYIASSVSQIGYSFASLWMNLGHTIDDLRYKELQKQKKYAVKFKENISLPPSDFVLLAANSDFVFFLDENRKVHIYSKDLLQHLEQRQKGVGSNPFFLFPRRNGLE